MLRDILNFKYLFVRKWQKFVLDFYVESSLHVALSVVSLAYISLKLAHEEVSFSLLIFIFSSALFAYNFVKYFSIFKAEKIKNTFQKLIFLISSFSLIVSINIFLQLVIIAKIFVLIGAILVLFYTIPINYRKDNLRNTNGWKIYVVVLTWVLLTVGVPLSINLMNYGTLLFYLLFIQGTYIFVSIIAFDIRDLKIDDPKLKTIPQQLGVVRSKLLGSNLLILLILITLYKFGFNTPFSVSALLCFVTLLILLNLVNSKSSKYFTNFWIESLPIFWAINFYLFSYF